MMSTPRAGKAGRERAGKTHATKTDTPNTKNMPTPEQLRLAQMYSDRNDEDAELHNKITQAIELTGRTTDEAIVALHDCDNDLNRAVVQLLEDTNGQNEWQAAGKKKKSQSSSSAKPSSTSVPNNKTLTSDRTTADFRSNERTATERGNDWGGARGRRGDSRAPPRFRGRGRESDENEKNRSDGGSRGGERGRGRGGSRGVGRAGRGRGRGGVSSSGFGIPPASNVEEKSFGSGPQIDTWTNDTADTTDKENVGAWGDMADDWSNDDWTGSLVETTVFTPTVTAHPDTNGGFDALPASTDSDLYLSGTPSACQTGSLGDRPTFRQLAVGTPPTSTPGGQPAGSAPCGQQAGSSPCGQQAGSAPCGQQAGSAPCGQQAGSAPCGQQAGSAPCGQPSSGQADQNSIGQRVDLNEMFAKTAEAAGSGGGRVESDYMPTFGKVVSSEGVMSSTAVSSSSALTDAVYMSQYAREATESIKNAVGIGSSSRVALQPSDASPPPPTHTQPSPPHHDSPPHDLPPHQRGGCSRQRTKLPPPSKIPASAVVMPGKMNFNVDVQFGTWDKAVSEAAFGFMSPPHATPAGLGADYANSADSVSMPGQPSLSSRLGPATTSPDLSATTPAAQQTLAPSGDTFPSAPTSTPPPPKEFAQSGLTQSAKMSPSPLEQLTFSGSQTDIKSNSYASQRTSMASGSVGSSKPAPSTSASQLPYGTSAYTSATYPSPYTTAAAAALSSGYSAARTVSPRGGGGADAQYSYPASQSQPSSALYQPPAPPGGQYPYNDGGQSTTASYDYTPAGGATCQQSGDGSGGGGAQYANHHGAGGGYNTAAAAAAAAAATAKLSDSLHKMAVGVSADETSTPTPAGGFDSAAGALSTAATAATGSTTGTMASSATGTSAGASLGLAPMSTTKSSLPATTKAPPNLPQGVPPVISHNYMIGQPFPFNLAPLQGPMYTYEDLQMLPQRVSVPGDYYMQFQPPTTLSAAGVGPGGAVRGSDPAAPATFPTLPYTADGKLGRLDAQSPVQAAPQPSHSAPNAPNAPQSAHQQFLNPGAIPPGYNYYYPLPPGGYSYQPALFHTQMPSVTNATHGGASTANPPFHKPAGYGSHGYGAGGPSADFGKAYGSGVGQSQPKVAASSISSTSSELSGPASAYSKAHSHTFDKAGFHGGTPPPFGLAHGGGGGGGGAGTQGLGAGPAGYVGPYGVQMMGHQAHSQMLHHHLQQDSSGSRAGGATQQPVTQPKPGVATSYNNQYWSNN